MSADIETAIAIALDIGHFARLIVLAGDAVNEMDVHDSGAALWASEYGAAIVAAAKAIAEKAEEASGLLDECRYSQDETVKSE